MVTHHESAALADGVALVDASGDILLGRQDLDLRCGLSLLLALFGGGFVGFGVGGVLGRGIELRGGGGLSLGSLFSGFLLGGLSLKGILDGSGLIGGGTILADRSSGTLGGSGGTLLSESNSAVLGDELGLEVSNGLLEVGDLLILLLVLVGGELGLVLVLLDQAVEFAELGLELVDLSLKLGLGASLSSTLRKLLLEVGDLVLESGSLGSVRRSISLVVKIVHGGVHSGGLLFLRLGSEDRALKRAELFLKGSDLALDLGDNGVNLDQGLVEEGDARDVLSIESDGSDVAE